MSSRQAVYEAIDSERSYQLRLAEAASGQGSGEHIHSVEEFTIYMDDYLRELKTQLSRNWTASGRASIEALDTIRKIAALAVACMEQNGSRQRGVLMPIIYQCGNCGDDHDDVSQERKCKVCGNETCTACQDNGSCWACADNDRTVDDKEPDEADDIEWDKEND